MSNNIGIKFWLHSIAILLILLFLLTPFELDALMPVKENGGGREISVTQENIEEIPKIKRREISPAQEEIIEDLSEEEIISIEEKIAEHIKQTAGEKRKILEEAEKEKVPEQKRPFIKEGEAEKIYPLKPKAREIEPLERHNVILGEKPTQLLLTLLLLSIIIYLLYRFALEEKSRK